MVFGTHTDPKQAQAKGVEVRKSNQLEIDNLATQLADDILEGDASKKILQTILLEAKKNGDLKSLQWVFEQMNGKAIQKSEVKGTIQLTDKEEIKRLKDNFDDDY